MSESILTSPQRSSVPRRYEASRSILLWDRFMNRFITVGGLAIIAAVLGIFVFILWQVLPLFRPARVISMREFSLPVGGAVLMGLDEHGRTAFWLDAEGTLHFTDLETGQRFPGRPLWGGRQVRLTAWRYHPGRQEILCATAEGEVERVALRFPASAGTSAATVAEPQVETQMLPELASKGYPVRAVDYGDSGTDKLLAVVQEVDGRQEVRAALLTQTRGLLGAGRIRVAATYDLGGQITGRVDRLLVDRDATGVVAATESGTVYYFRREGQQLELRQVFRPFADRPHPGVAFMEYLLGDVTLVLANSEGVLRLYSLYRPEGRSDRVFGPIHSFPSLPGAPGFFAASQRNKAFLVGHRGEVRLCYATTETIRWTGQWPEPIRLCAINSKYDRIALWDETGRLRLLRLDDPHPEAGWRAFFGRIWYEGADRPRYEWQSTGGSDAFEPKLSMVPLIVGTLKGTFYAMLFAVPVALLGALYVSQFAPPGFRGVAKPVMEVMASLPSVVLGFLGALWLAPRIETRVPSLLMIFLLVPLTALLMGAVWSRLPIRWRARVPAGWEFLALAPVLLGAVWAGWGLGPVVERWVFVVADPVTGERVADFRLWWPWFTGADFQQRNSVVVGFMMGFAVIPIIFTLAEDALSNVPATLRSASLALGASRWQTALYVVVPTAAAGIFSALMGGLGRAVGETMIVVMATGNTPILSFNPFSGMRTLSANLAVELPEAPHHSTLYRALFLGALLLFVFTFLINTAAEVLRQRLRERFKNL